MFCDTEGGDSKMEKKEEKKQLLSTVIASFRQFGKSQWLILLLVGVLFVVIAMPTGSSKENTDRSGSDSTEFTDVEDAKQQTDWDSYRESIEGQLESLLSQVEGVGEVQVMVTFSGSGELVVEKDIPQVQSQIEEGDSNGGTRNTKESSWNEATVYIQKDGESVPYVVKELVPEIEGICVIAQGGDNGNVAKNISDAVQALFPIEAHKIKVMKMK